MPCKISFPKGKHDAVILNAHTPLADELTVQNSPILFGCRTGICGTCLVTILGNTPPPDAEEKEMLDVLAPDTPNARLACQLDITHDLEICPYGSSDQNPNPV
ncbi:MAG: 2Fe-2S iron-sulfur cluster-binding protein [Cyanobacteria bacterium P01_F01_bin.13]